MNSGETRGAHQAPAARADPSAPPVPEPSDAERARTLVVEARQAALSTVGVDPAGYPFGSVVTPATDRLGRPVLCLSDLAGHTVNLAADPRASLMVVARAAPGSDPLAAARTTLVGDLRPVSEPERDAAHETYRAAHPGAFYAAFDDFRFYRLEVRAVRYVGGFARMSWVSPGEYTAAEADPLAQHAEGITGHMNDDHADGVLALGRALGGCPEAGWARMVAVDRYGFEVRAGESGAERPRTVRIGFDHSCDTPEQVRAAMIALLRRVRSEE